ncbi:MAG: type I DNA topoisomerase [Polyangiales bacterium]
MSKILLIVESPAKAKTIKKYVGAGYEVLASKGHIKDLPKRGGVDIDNGFQETYELLEEKGKSEVVRAIRAAAKKANKVLLATDPDREGEAIAYHLMEVARTANKDAEIKRVLFEEITKRGVAEGLEHPRDLDSNLYEAQRTRRVLDRIGGYPLSSLLWKKLAFGLSAGRVQTPALRIIVDRQHERDAFVSVDYWLVDVRLKGAKPHSFMATLQSVEGEKLDKIGSRLAVLDEKAAARYVADLKTADYQVKEITKRKASRKAPAPYTTSKLQQDAANRLSMPPKRTMRIAQQLYEGITLGRGQNAEAVGLITYMRTDSVRLSPDAVNECREHIRKKYGKDSVPDKPNFFKTKKQNVQDAHEAIRPTRLDLPPEAVSKYLNDPQRRLYKLIWDRFVASQMTAAVFDQTGIDIEGRANDRVYGLRASGSVLKIPGWRAVYGATTEPLAGEEPSPEDRTDEDDSLPELSEGETLHLVIPPGAESHHKQTEPPPLFTEATLVKKLEEEGIGRPSTYAEIISKVEQRAYVEKDGNKLVPTPLGKLVVEKLVEENFDLADIGFTRKLEEDLDAVGEARAKRLDVLQPFHERLQAQIARAIDHQGKWWPEPVETGETCPESGDPLVKRWGRNGPFIGCTKYPECRYTLNIGPDGEVEPAKEPELTEYDCHECGAKMNKRWGRNGWFLGCSRYPECKHTRAVPLGYKCPKCKTGDIVPIKAKGRGRPFYGCTNYRSEEPCDFRVWQEPVGEKCPKCGSDFLVPLGGKKNPKLKCPNDTCDYERSYDPDELREQGESLEVPPAAGSATG